VNSSGAKPVEKKLKKIENGRVKTKLCGLTEALPSNKVYSIRNADKPGAEPIIFGVIDSYGIEPCHPIRENHQPKLQRSGKKGFAFWKWIVGGKFCLLTDKYRTRPRPGTSKRRMFPIRRFCQNGVTHLSLAEFSL